MKSEFIYLRGLRHVDHTVFAVNTETDKNNKKRSLQKYYYDPQFGKKIAYSSGQQVKRSIIEGLNLPFAAITFNWEIDKDDKANQKDPHSPCDPTFTDQLLGGYMKLLGGKNIKGEVGQMNVKRRSPLSISAMRPLHPLLGGIESPEEDLSFDRTSHAEHHKVEVYGYDKESGEKKKLSEEELNKWLTTNKRSLPNRAFIPDQTRTSGLFVYDIAIDLRTLFCVSTNKLEPELFPEIEEKLRNKGWIESKNIFGRCLVCPKEQREEIVKRLAHSIINWRITSNQSRTFSPMETLVIAISDNANQITYAIRGELRDDTERPTAVPRIDEGAKTDIYVTPVANAYIQGSIGSHDALEKAEQELIDRMLAFDYEHQLADTHKA